MVNRHNRIPALTILLVAAFAGGAYLVRANRAAGKPREGLAALEAKIKEGNAGKADWLNYAMALKDEQRHAQAALAFRQVLELEPYNRQVKIEYVVALANANDKAGLGNYLKDLVYAEAKLSLELFERKELKPFLADPVVGPQFEALQKEARAQAMD
jgi:hypothetical protein